MNGKQGALFQNGNFWIYYLWKAKAKYSLFYWLNQGFLVKTQPSSDLKVILIQLSLSSLHLKIIKKCNGIIRQPCYSQRIPSIMEMND